MPYARRISHILTLLFVLVAIDPAPVAQPKGEPINQQTSDQEKIPTVDFCTLLRNIYRYVDKPVRITARWEHSREFIVLRDSRCEAEYPIEGVIVRVDDRVEPAKTQIATIESREFGGQALVTLVGILHDPANGEGFFRFDFKVTSFTRVDYFIIPYTGALHAGSTYRAAVLGDPDTELRLVRPLRVELHTAVRVEWQNVADFPMLANLRGHRTIVFRVVSQERKQMGERRWNRTLQCKILRVE